MLLWGCSVCSPLLYPTLHWGRTCRGVEVGYCMQAPCCHFFCCWYALVWLLKWIWYTMCVCLCFVWKPKKCLTLFQPENLAQKLPNLVELWVCVGVLIYFYYSEPSYLKNNYGMYCLYLSYPFKCEGFLGGQERVICCWFKADISRCIESHVSIFYDFLFIV